jgi:hypothetical protein
VVRIETNSIKKLLSETFPRLCGSKESGKVRPYDEEVHSSHPQIHRVWLAVSLKMFNNRRRQFSSCPFRQPS